MNESILLPLLLVVVVPVIGIASFMLVFWWLTQLVDKWIDTRGKK